MASPVLGLHVRKLLQTKWFLLPPALAVVLLIGPFRPGDTEAASRAQPETATTARADLGRPAVDEPRSPIGTPAAPDRDTAPTRRAATPEIGSAIPQLPSTLRIVSTLLGVLLLGGCGLLIYSRSNGGEMPPLVSKLLGHSRGSRTTADGARTRPTDVCSVRQSVRLSPKARVHVLEFDDTVLLVGETEGGITLVHSQPGRGAEEDEQMALAATADDGATPRDLREPVRRQPRATEPIPGEDDRLADFRQLLQQAKRRIPS